MTIETQVPVTPETHEQELVRTKISEQDSDIDNYVYSKEHREIGKKGCGGENLASFPLFSSGNNYPDQPEGITTCESERSIHNVVGATEVSKTDGENLSKKKTISENPATKLIFDAWNSKDIPVCHKTLTDRMKSAINARLKDGYSTEDICKAIENYAAVVRSKDHFWSYSGWDLTTFLNPRNLDRFLDENEPLEVFRNGRDRGKEETKAASPSRYGFVDLADLTDDPAAEPDKTPVWCIANDDIREAFYAWKEGRYNGRGG